MLKEMKVHLKCLECFHYHEEIHLIELNFPKSSSDQEKIRIVTNIGKLRVRKMK